MKILRWSNTVSRYVAVFTVTLAACCTAVPVFAQSLTLSNKLEFRLQYRLSAGALRHDDDFIYTPGLSEYLLKKRFARTSTHPHPKAFLSLTAGRLCGIRRYELSRLDCALQGSEMGVTLGLFLGAVGNTTGAWNERSSWYLVGAMTALGAILGGTAGADDPQ
jgi:hypothetical protein